MAVTPAGGISFRYNYSISGRQETLTIGRYGPRGVTLAEARERLSEAKKMIVAGKSPAREKARDKKRVKNAVTFGAWAVVGSRVVAQRNGIGELVTPLSGKGLGFILCDVPNSSLADILDADTLGQVSMLWWHLDAGSGAYRLSTLAPTQ